MVNNAGMLISDFARATGLTQDTIRFYVRRGLLDPEAGLKGGRNRYQVFTQEHVHVAELIRIGQSLGLSLGEIGTLLGDAKGERMSKEQRLAILHEHKDRLLRRAAELNAMADYLGAKIHWVAEGEHGEQPKFTDFVQTQRANTSSRRVGSKEPARSFADLETK